MVLGLPDGTVDGARLGSLDGLVHRHCIGGRMLAHTRGLPARQYEGPGPVVTLCCLQYASKQSGVGETDGPVMGLREGAALGAKRGENDGRQLHAIGGTMRVHENFGREHWAPG